MRRIKFVLIFLLFYLLSQNNYAQDTEYIFRDSSINQMEAVISKTESASSKKSIFLKKEDQVKNALQLPGNKVLKDSAEALKNSLSFDYAKKLDSLLKTAQKNSESKPIASSDAGSSLVESFFSSLFTKIFFWSLAIFFVCFIIYKLFLAEGIFQKSAVLNNLKVMGEGEAGRSAAMDFEQLIILAKANKDFRLAIRYHYLQTLQQLTDKGIIQYSADKTNAQYNTELYGNVASESFSALTLNYEYAWYGDFTITDTMFKKIENNFIIFNKNL